MFDGLFGRGKKKLTRDGVYFEPSEHYRQVGSFGNIGWCCTNPDCRHTCWQDECPTEPCMKCGENHSGQSMNVTHQLRETSKKAQKGVGGMFDFGDVEQRRQDTSFFGLNEDYGVDDRD